MSPPNPVEWAPTSISSPRFKFTDSSLFCSWPSTETHGLEMTKWFCCPSIFQLITRRGQWCAGCTRSITSTGQWAIYIKDLIDSLLFKHRVGWSYSLTHQEAAIWTTNQPEDCQNETARQRFHLAFNWWSTEVNSSARSSSWMDSICRLCSIYYSQDSEQSP